MSTKLTINRGTTYTITFNYLKGGVAASLSGATVRFTMKSSEYDTDTTDATALVSKDVTDGSGLGVATITLDPADTATITPSKKYYYDIKVAEAGGDVYKVIEGIVVLDGSPTNRLV